jgi:steroid delta-isomerase-like uncharacterized protein
MQERSMHPEGYTMSDANKAVVREYYRLLDSGNTDGMKAIFHDDLNWNFVGIGELNTESIGGVVQAFKAVFPDMQHAVGDQSAEGTTVTTPVVFTGTHQGELMGIPASGASVTFRGINIHEVVDGRIKSAETVVDMMGMMQQIGAIPTPG